MTIASRILSRIIRQNWPVYIPAIDASDRSRRRRRFARRSKSARGPRALRPFLFVAALLGWPGFLFIVIVRAKSPKKWAVFRFTLRHSLHFSDTLTLKETIKGSATSVDDWVTDGESLALLNGIRRIHSKSTGRSDEAWKAIANDKAEFAAFCRQNDLSHPKLHSVWNPDGALDTAEARCGQHALIWKPRTANNARGVTAFDADADDADCAELARRFGGGILQERLTLHPSLRERGIWGMPHARLITGQWPGGETELIASYFVCPRPGSFASNNGIGAKLGIDMETGTLLEACKKQRGAPDTPAGAVGSELPHWNEAQALVLRAHERFPPGAVALGWDVAFSDRGPILLETNTGFSFFVPQLVKGTPAGSMTIGRFVDSWVDLADQRRIKP